MIIRYAILAAAAATTMLLVGALWEATECYVVGDYVSDNPAFRKRWWVVPYLYCHPILYGFAFTAAFIFVARYFTETVSTGFGLAFGLALFLVGSLPIFVLLSAAVDIPFAVVPLWILRNLSQYVAAGAVLGSIVTRWQSSMPSSQDN